MACPHIPPVSHRQATPTDSHYPNVTITFRCTEGALIGASSIQCRNGQWTPAPPTCGQGTELITFWIDTLNYMCMDFIWTAAIIVSVFNSYIPTTVCYPVATSLSVSAGTNNPVQIIQSHDNFLLQTACRDCIESFCSLFFFFFFFNKFDSFFSFLVPNGVYSYPCLKSYPAGQSSG